MVLGIRKVINIKTSSQNPSVCVVYMLINTSKYNIKDVFFSALDALHNLQQMAAINRDATDGKHRSLQPDPDGEM